MARTRICGFEQGNLTAGVPEYTPTGTCSVVTSPVNGSTYALRANPTTTNNGFASILGLTSAGTTSVAQSNGATAWFKFDFRYATKPSANSEEIAVALNLSNQSKATLRINSDGTISMYQTTAGTGLLATGTTVLSANTWYRIEWKVGTESSSNASNAVYELKINGTSEFSGSNGDTTNSANGTLALGKRTSRNANTVDFFYDNVVIDDANWPGESYILALVPNGAGNYSGATSGTWQDVDEVPPDDDTTYLGFTSNTSRHSVALTSCATAGISGTIHCIQPLLRSRDTASVTVNHIGFIRTSGTDTDSGTGTNPATGYTITGAKIFSTDPSDSAAWTTTKLDALEVGVYMSASNATEQRVTSMMVMVEFTPAADTFTATSALSAGGITLSASATFAPGTDTGTTALSTGGATLSASAVFTKPTYEATSSLSVGPSSLTASATFSDNIYTATSEFTVGGVSLNATATFVKPIYTGSSSLTVAGSTLSATATFVKPTYTGSSTLTVSNTTLSASATFEKPTYTASSTLSVGPTALSASATFAVDTFTGTSSLQTPATTLSGTATFTKPTYTGTSILTTAGVTLESSATFVKPTYTGTSTLVVGETELSSSGTFVKPTYTATSILTAPKTSLSASATFSINTYTGTVSFTTPIAELTSSATFVSPTYTAVSVLTTSSASISASGQFTKPTYTASVVLLTSAAILSATAIFQPLVVPPIRDATLNYIFTKDGTLDYNYIRDYDLEYLYNRMATLDAVYTRNGTIDVDHIRETTLEN
jgi:epidermal growth factor receptor substrate 15